MNPIQRRLIELAQIQPHDRVLDAAAGGGDLADAVRDRQPQAVLFCLEQDKDNRRLLRQKQHRLVGRHPWVYFPAYPYNKVLLASPDLGSTELEHAYDKLLAPGGRLVAYFTQDQVRSCQRWLASWLTAHRASTHLLAHGRSLVLDKPARVDNAEPAPVEMTASVLAELAGPDPLGFAHTPRPSALPLAERLLRLEQADRLLEALEDPSLLQEHLDAQDKVQRIEAKITAACQQIEQQLESRLLQPQGTRSRLQGETRRLVGELHLLRVWASWAREDLTRHTERARNIVVNVLKASESIQVQVRFTKGFTEEPLLHRLFDQVIACWQRLPSDPQLDLTVEPSNLNGGRTICHPDGRRTVLVPAQLAAPAILVHELGHLVEEMGSSVSVVDSPAQAVAKEFLALRVSPRAPLIRMASLFPNLSWDPNLIVRPGDLHRCLNRRQGFYMTRVYPSGATEVVSVVLEKLFSDPVGMARNDPQMLRLGVGMLNGTLRQAVAL